MQVLAQFVKEEYMRTCYQVIQGIQYADVLLSSLRLPSKRNIKITIIGMVQECDGIYCGLQQNVFHLLWDILFLDTFAEIIGHKAVFHNRTICQNVQVCLLKHRVVELSLLRITVSILQDFNKSLFYIPIYIVIISHNPTMKRI